MDSSNIKPSNLVTLLKIEYLELQLCIELPIDTFTSTNFFMAMDASGLLYAYTEKPIVQGSIFIEPNATAYSEFIEDISDRVDCRDWKESIVGYSL